MAENYISARQIIRKANEIRDQYPGQIEELPGHSSLLGFISQFSYNELIGDGSILLESGNYNMAYEKFLAAASMHQKSGFEFDTDLSCLIGMAAEPVLKTLCGVGEVKVKKNQLTEAKIIYQQCHSLIIEYGLTYATELHEQLTKLNNHIFEKQCEKEHMNFEGVIESFWVHVKIGDYIMATQILEAAEKIMDENFYCDLDGNYIEELRTKYYPFAQYQELNNASRNALIQHEYDKVMVLFDQMAYLSFNYPMIRKEFETVPLANFLSVRKNLEILCSFFDYSRHKNNFEMSLKLLAGLQHSRLPETKTRYVQKKLGHLMAENFKNREKGIDETAVIEEFITDKYYYRYFTKALSNNPLRFGLNKIPKKFAWFQDRICILATRSDQENMK